MSSFKRHHYPLAVLNDTYKMKIAIRFMFIAGLTLFGLQQINAQETTQTNDYHHWWRDRPDGKAFSSEQTNQLPRIRVQGNRFVDPDGKPVLFRGVSIGDPDKIEHQETTGT